MKNEYKGIPGPWKRGGKDNMEITAKGGLIYVANICGIPGYASPEATANLISAAPDLLSILIKAVEDHEKLECWFNTHKGNKQVDYPVPDWVNEARTEIGQILNLKPIEQ